MERPPPLQLSSNHAEAFSEVLQFLLCGEESAAIAFDRLAMSEAPHGDLSNIAAEEREHQTLLESLVTRLPAPVGDNAMTAATRSYFVRLGAHDSGVHFSRIVALDSAVCALIGELRKRNNPLAKEPDVNAVLIRIHGDEARHVMLAHRYASQLIDSESRQAIFSATRERLITLLMRRAAAFDQLGLDCDRMLRVLRRIPRVLVS